MAASVALYGIFLTIETVRHQSYFQHADGDSASHYATGHVAGAHAGHRPSGWHGLGIIAALLPVILLAEELAAYIDHAIEILGAPAALGGVLIAGLFLAPEASARSGPRGPTTFRGTRMRPSRKAPAKGRASALGWRSCSWARRVPGRGGGAD